MVVVFLYGGDDGVCIVQPLLWLWSWLYCCLGGVKGVVCVWFSCRNDSGCVLDVGVLTVVVCLRCNSGSFLCSLK